MTEEVVRWADDAQYHAAPIDPFGGPKVFLLWMNPDPLGAIASMCRMYEGKPTYDLRSITKEERLHYWDQIQKTHLKAPLESVKLHFFIEGVDRALTHQMVRQRTAVYAQESLRFAVKERIVDEVNVPPSVKNDDAMMKIWDGALMSIDAAYTAMVNSGIPAEDARGLLPHATLTRLHYITDLRNLAEHSGNRLCTQAQFVWRSVFLGIIKAIREYHPQHNANDQNWQNEIITGSGIFKPVCFQVGHCPFTASFDRGCTIRERVQAGRFDLIDEAEFMSDPDAGRTHDESR
jgi:thymidylate synthase ThyX